MHARENLPWWRHDRPWGFRFSWMDALIFAGGLVCTASAWPFIGAFALIAPYLLGHFFLFCNTFRVGGERSLLWVGSFLLNIFLWPKTGNLAIHAIVQAVITVGLIAQCVWGKNYHGFACTKINPKNFRHGAMSEGAFTRRVLLACRCPKSIIEILVGRRLEEFESQTD